MFNAVERDNDIALLVCRLGELTAVTYPGSRRILAPLSAISPAIHADHSCCPVLRDPYTFQSVTTAEIHNNLTLEFLVNVRAQNYL